MVGVPPKVSILPPKGRGNEEPAEEGAGPREQGCHGRVLLDDAVGQDRRQELRGAHLSQSIPSVPKDGVEGMPSQGLGEGGRAGPRLPRISTLPRTCPSPQPAVRGCTCEQRQASVSFREGS